MIDEILEILKARNQTITMAESCTGGQVASKFTAISGVSSVFNGSCVSYSNEIKSKLLGVKEKTLLEHGAVSEECVSEMLEGVLKLFNADGAIAVSGVAGPTGGTPNKPVGTVYIGVEYLGNRRVERFQFKGDREAIQSSATNSSIELFREILDFFPKNS